jgi:hypothetical protein
MVVEIGGYTVTDSAGVKTNMGHFISVFEKQNRKYICTRDMGSSGEPLEKK